MIYMCKVYEFPVKKEIPKKFEERLDKLATEYVNVMVELVNDLYGDNEPTEEDYQEFMELIAFAYAKSLEKAYNELE